MRAQPQWYLVHHFVSSVVHHLYCHARLCVGSMRHHEGIRQAQQEEDVQHSSSRTALTIFLVFSLHLLAGIWFVRRCLQQFQPCRISTCIYALPPSPSPSPPPPLPLLPLPLSGDPLASERSPPSDAVLRLHIAFGRGVRPLLQTANAGHAALPRRGVLQGQSGKARERHQRHQRHYPSTHRRQAGRQSSQPPVEDAPKRRDGVYFSVNARGRKVKNRGWYQRLAALIVFVSFRRLFVAGLGEA